MESGTPGIIRRTVLLGLIDAMSAYSLYTLALISRPAATEKTAKAATIKGVCFFMGRALSVNALARSPADAGSGRLVTTFNIRKCLMGRICENHLYPQFLLKKGFNHTI